MQAYGNASHTEHLLACHSPPIITIPHDMKAPIYIYYELNNFHQNHRRCATLDIGTHKVKLAPVNILDDYYISVQIAIAYINLSN